MIETFKKYTTSYRWGWKLLTVLSAGFLAAYIICFFLDTGVKPIGVVVFPGGLLLSLIPAWKDRKFFRSLEGGNQLEQVAADFTAAVSMRKNRIRFGRRWIFCKGKCRLVRYEDIRQIYQYVHRTNFMEDDRALKYVDSNGKTRVLCKLELQGKSDEELHKMADLILSKNPGVKIGYK